MEGYKHIIDCHCVLPQYRNSKQPLYFKFQVFSMIDDGNNVIPKTAQCPNCGIIHRVYDICKSEIVTGREESRGIITKDDLAYMLPDDYINILTSYDCPVADWEQLLFILENKKWNDFIVLTYEKEDDEVSGKILRFTDQGSPRIEPYIHSNVVG